MEFDNDLSVNLHMNYDHEACSRAWWRRRTDGKDIVDKLLKNPRSDLFPNLTKNDKWLRRLVEKHCKFPVETASDDQILTAKAAVGTLAFYTMPRSYKWDQPGFIEEVVKLRPDTAKFRLLDHHTLCQLMWALYILHSRKYTIATDEPDSGAYRAHCNELEQKRLNEDKELEKLFVEKVPPNARAPRTWFDRIGSIFTAIMDILAAGEK